MKIDGGCHCGDITYEAEIDPGKVGICHCTDCQALSGTAFRTIVLVPDDAFTMLSGAPKIYVKTADSGAKREQAFCPECGSAIYSTAVGDGPKFFSVRLGTARQRGALPPKIQYWYRSAQPWLSDLDSVAKIEKE